MFVAKWNHPNGLFGDNPYETFTDAASDAEVMKKQGCSVVIEIEAGKAYRNGRGDVEVVRLVAIGDDFPFEGCTSLHRYMSDGRYVADRGDDDVCASLNLIATA